MTKTRFFKPISRHPAPWISGFLIAFTFGLGAAESETPFDVASLTGTAEEKGLAIATEADRRDQGFGDTQSEMTMTLMNRRGEKSVRRMMNRTLEQQDDGDMSLVIFDEPADVAGTALLTHAHKSGSDDQWIYLPALRRVKRIASNNQAGPFMGSEFAYEDLSSQEVEKYDHSYVGTESLDGRDCFVLERVPRAKRSGYSKQRIWIDTEHFRSSRIDYFDRKGSRLKTLTFKDYRLYKDQFWRAGLLSMINHQTGKSTELTWESYEFGTGLTERDFDRASLARSR